MRSTTTYTDGESSPARTFALIELVGAESSMEPCDKLRDVGGKTIHLNMRRQEEEIQQHNQRRFTAAPTSFKQTRRKPTETL